MKRKLVIVSTLITTIVISAFGFVNRSTANTSNNCEPQIESNNVALSDIGINGGLTVNNNNGSVSQFLATMPDLFYMVQRKSKDSNIGRAITQEKLKNAKSLSDVIEHYPSSFINNYNSVIISGVLNGELVELKSPTADFTNAQMELITSVDMGGYFQIIVNYNKENYNSNIDERQMKVSFIVVPEIEAVYDGGYEQMISYLKENSIKKIAAKNFSYIPQPSIYFVVNEDGITENVKLKASSKDDEIDQLLIELIKKMPKWKPAKNAKGINVKQEFVFNVGQDGC